MHHYHPYAQHQKVIVILPEFCTHIWLKAIFSFTASKWEILHCHSTVQFTNIWQPPSPLSVGSEDISSEGIQPSFSTTKTETIRSSVLGRVKFPQAEDCLANLEDNAYLFLGSHIYTKHNEGKICIWHIDINYNIR